MGHVADTSIRRGMLYSAQTIAAAVDADLRRYLALAEVLAHSPALQSNDLTAFDREARRAAVALGGAWIVVADADGTIVVVQSIARQTPAQGRCRRCRMVRQPGFAAAGEATVG